MAASALIDTPSYSARLREKLLQREGCRVLLARIAGSKEATDSYAEVNCNGFGRVRTFERYLMHLRTIAHPSASAKPLLRGHPQVNQLRTQVFQLAGCNWRCWYCFVDDELLSGSGAQAEYLSAAEMVDLYLSQEAPPRVIDLSGGQPDLVPEWCLWTMRALEERGLRGSNYVWIDDNLSTRYMWEHLSPEEIRYMAAFPGHSRVGCFKGFDEDSFSSNTQAHPAGYREQFTIFRDLVAAGFDMYAYATFTVSDDRDLPERMGRFLDQLQSVSRTLPLRTIPLKIVPFAALRGRRPVALRTRLDSQHAAFACWEAELSRRFSADEIALPYEAVAL